MLALKIMEMKSLEFFFFLPVLAGKLCVQMRM